jgi:hypothetical protein
MMKGGREKCDRAKQTEDRKQHSMRLAGRVATIERVICALQANEEIEDVGGKAKPSVQT